MANSDDRTLVHVGSLAALEASGRRIIKAGTKQIVLLHSQKGVYACTNRCPHEGYPLKEGSLSQGCILTCNWHNWKFDLESGETLVGGDRLRRYPVHLKDGEIWLDLTDPTSAERAAVALSSLRQSFKRHEYDRMAREISRLQRAEADPLDAVRAAIGWTHEQFEFGTTHAYAAAADWLALRDGHARDDAERLVPLVEILGHLAWDSLREARYPYHDAAAAYDPAGLVAAIEREDEPAAIALLRGALAGGLGYQDLERPLAEAALAHYQDFGHSAIYLHKTGQLIERLGPAVSEPLLVALVRSLVFATREDLIPEFRKYGETLAAWDGRGDRPVGAEDLARLSVPRALARCLESSAEPQALFHALLGAAAWQFLHFDLPLQERVDNPVSQNVGWLDLTHAITFANAVRVLCDRHPHLWARGLLQIACFVGRNADFVDRELDTEIWCVSDARTFFAKAFAGLLDHGQAEYIVSAHLLKLLSAVHAEIAAAPEAPWRPDLLAAAKRFLQSPLKRKHAARSARQALSFVAVED
jgi:nitrite reductase/ring-hydroxylating ferredoxin subunit